MLVTLNEAKLDKSAITIWYIPLQVTAGEVEACCALLSKDELARAERFQFDSHKRRYIVAHGRLRAILASYAGIPARELRFQTTQYGKPFLEPSCDFHFNLSHSGELAVVAVGANELGVDLELIRPIENFENVATRFFSLHEIDELQTYPAAERLRAFYRCWTRKEAFVKALGGGLSVPLSSFTMSLAEKQAALLETTSPEHLVDWTIAALDPGLDYVGALAVRHSCRVEGRWWGSCELVMTRDNREDESKGE